MRRMVWAGIALGGMLLAIGPLAGCAGGGPTNPADQAGGPNPQSTPPPTATTSPAAMSGATVRRTGGFAGVNQSIVIAPDGSWTYSDARGGTTESGRFTEAQLAELARLAIDPRLVREVRATPTSECRDAFIYTLTVGPVNGSFEDCGPSHPAAQAIIRHISDATAF